MATDLDICNLALTRLGHEVIPSISSSGNRASRLCSAHYDTTRQTLLREFAWRFAIKRDVLTADIIHDITAATQASPVVITSASHGFSNGSVVFIASVIGMGEINNRTFTVANATTDTFELSGIDGTGYTAYSSGGKLYGYVATEYAYRFPLPSDCIRLLRINDAELDEYRVEAGGIVTDEGSVSVEYIEDVDDPARFDASFVDILAQRLAAEICYALTDDANLTKETWNLYNGKATMARAMDTRQGTPRGLDADNWTSARF